MLHSSAFEYLPPSPDQLEEMKRVRILFTEFAAALDSALIDGPDKTYIFRHLRESAMWANVCLTRNGDGSPRR